MNSYNVVSEQFNDAISREGKTVTSSDGATSYTCLFRKNSDKNTSDNRLTIFYPATGTIAQGQLLKYNNNYFLSLNQETDENEIYQKSDLLEVNTEIHTIVRDSSSGTGYELYIKAYAEDLSSVGVTGNSQISVVGGNISFITQDDSNSRNLAIDATFSALGATWKIINIYFKTGLCYVYTERSAGNNTAPTYTLSVTGSNTCTNGKSITLSASAAVTDNSVTTTILNPTITWSSSDTSVATISSSGVVTGIAAGAVTITAAWIEHGTTATYGMTIVSEVVITYTVSIPQTRSVIYVGTSYTYTANFLDSTSATVDLTPQWTLTLNYPTLQTGFVTMTVNSDNSAKISPVNNEDIVGTTVTLTVTDPDNTCSDSKTIELASL